MKQGNNFKDLKSILNDILLKTGSTPLPAHYKIWEVWNTVVGPHIATRAQPETVRKGVLIVTVINSVWMQELGFMKVEILERIQQKLGSPVIQDIRFKLGQIPQSKDMEQPPQLPELDTEETEKIEQHTTTIKDHDLRNSLRSLFEMNVRSKKKRKTRD